MRATRSIPMAQAARGWSLMNHFRRRRDAATDLIGGAGHHTGTHARASGRWWARSGLEVGDVVEVQGVIPIGANRASLGAEPGRVKLELVGTSVPRKAHRQRGRLP